jgi:hypothetical protein
MHELLTSPWQNNQINASRFQNPERQTKCSTFVIDSHKLSKLLFGLHFSCCRLHADIKLKLVFL